MGVARAYCEAKINSHSCSLAAQEKEEEEANEKRREVNKEEGGNEKGQGEKGRGGNEKGEEVEEPSSQNGHVQQPQSKKKNQGVGTEICIINEFQVGVYNHSKKNMWRFVFRMHFWWDLKFLFFCVLFTNYLITKVDTNCVNTNREGVFPLFEKYDKRKCSKMRDTKEKSVCLCVFCWGVQSVSVFLSKSFLRTNSLPTENKFSPFSFLLSTSFPMCTTHKKHATCRWPDRAKSFALSRSHL